MEPNHQHRIVIIDDDRDLAEVAAWEVEEAGYEPVLMVEGKFQAVDELIAQLPQDTYGVLCDHRLNKSGLANFYGADLVAALYDLKVPALLDTQYYDMDSDVSIRKHRHKIPVLLERGNVDAWSIQEGIKICLSEFSGTIASDRKPYRNIVRLVDISEKANQTVVDVIVASWNPQRAVRLPLSLIQEWILEFQPAIGTRLIAKVNTGAEHPEDLYFTDFELAPKPNEIDDNA